MMNKVKEKLLKGERPIGTFEETGSQYVVEALGYTGLDYIIIDNEHAPTDIETSVVAIKNCELNGLTPIARVRNISRDAVLKLLDVGAQGLIVPYVKTIEECKNLVAYGKYPPIGQRGFSTSRKDGFGYKLGLSVADEMKYYNDEVLLIPQCETKEAFDQIEEIVNIDGIDGIFIGPYDLSISLGVPGDFDCDIFKNAVKRIVEVVHKANKFVIMFAGNNEKVKEAYDFGIDSVAYSLDPAVLIEAYKKIVNDVRSIK